MKMKKEGFEWRRMFEEEGEVQKGRIQVFEGSGKRGEGREKEKDKEGKGGRGVRREVWGE
jgi:hypothetical protein